MDEVFLGAEDYTQLKKELQKIKILFHMLEQDVLEEIKVCLNIDGTYFETDHGCNKSPNSVCRVTRE